MNWLKSVKISKQITMLVAVAAAGFIAVGAVYFMGNQRLETAQAELSRANQGVTLINEIRVGFLQNRRSEKDFFLRVNKKYADRHAAAAEQVLPLFDQLSETHVAAPRTPAPGHNQARNAAQ